MEFTADGPRAIPLWINGHAYLSMGEALYDAVHPQTGAVTHRVPLCGATEAVQAVLAARTAQPKWAALGLNARRNCLAALADGLERYREHFASLLRQEIALDENEAAAEVAAAIAALRDTAVGETGIAGIVVDATRPLSAFAAAMTPALLAGATVVVKPSPKAPGAVFALCELSARSHWPAGVLNLLQGDTAAIKGLCAAGIDRLIYRGDAALGAEVAALAAAAGVVCLQQTA
ncbi:MAG: aldehyde dehydrogenase family protein [Azonexus sp.]|jgi:acyl-CoA reductase-like NAD-dependent aldehyde dehydrogenase|nr:aldehyde dehydrogenase family protein [Azonexus sp.]